MPSHNDTDFSRAHEINLLSGRLATNRQILTDDFVVQQSSPPALFLDPNGSDRIVQLPPIQPGGGRFFYITNLASDGSLLDVRDSANVHLSYVAYRQGAMFVVSSEEEWSAGPAVFGAAGPNHGSGLVPDPGPVAGSSKVLFEDGVWRNVFSVGIVDAFKYITDGTNTAEGSGPDTFKIRSSDSSISVTVANNDPTHGDSVNLTANEAAIDHDALLNFVANKHIDHTAVTLTAGLGISGGGDISASRTFSLDLTELSIVVPDLANDYAVFHDASGAVPARALWSTVNGILDHNALLNYSANRHIDHTAVSIVAGIGLSGGGDISASRTLSIDFTEFDALDTITAADLIPYYDVSEADHGTVTVAQFNAALDHNSLLNYVANQHIDHSTVSVIAGSGLTGGGAITASVTLNIGAGSGIAVAADSISLDINGLTADSIASGDFLAFWDISGSDNNKITFANFNAALSLTALSGYVANEHINHTSVTLTAGAGLTGGGDISASRTFAVGAGAGITVNADDVALNFNGLTADTPVEGDFFAFWDISGSDHNKVTLANLRLALIPNADKGDITTSADGLTWTIDNQAVTLAKIVNFSATQRLWGRNTAGAGTAEEVTISQALDWLGSTQGQILFRGATGWTILAPGTSGQVLQSGGAAANVSWATVAGTGDVTAASAFGTDNRVIRSDGTGKGVQSSGVTLDDSNNLSGIGTINSGAITSSGGIDLSGRTDATITSPAAGLIAVEGNVVNIVGKRTIPVLPGACRAKASGGATKTSYQDVDCWSFNGTSATRIRFAIAMPKSVDESQTITFKCFGVVDTGGAAGHTASFKMAAKAFSHDDVAWTTTDLSTGAQEALMQWTANDDVLVSAESSAITVDGTWAEGDLVLFEFWRDPADADDDSSATFLIFNIHVYITEIGSNDT